MFDRPEARIVMFARVHVCFLRCSLRCPLRCTVSKQQILVRCFANKAGKEGTFWLPLACVLLQVLSVSCLTLEHCSKVLDRNTRPGSDFCPGSPRCIRCRSNGPLCARLTWPSVVCSFMCVFLMVTCSPKEEIQEGSSICWVPSFLFHTHMQVCSIYLSFKQQMGFVSLLCAG